MNRQLKTNELLILTITIVCAIALSLLYITFNPAPIQPIDDYVPDHSGAIKVFIPDEPIISYWIDGERLYFRQSEIDPKDR